MKLIFILLICMMKLISCTTNNLQILYPPQMTRIVGGENAREGQAPYQCSIQLYQQHFCGCALISSEWILTASHCVNGQRPESLSILVGTNNLKSGGTYYPVRRYIKHPKFNQPAFAYDIALIQVQRTINFDDKVQPIEYSSEEVQENSTLQLTGWGRLATNGMLPQYLQVITLRAISTERCKQIYQNRNVHDSHLCTLNKVGEGACNGDSGGPLIYENKLVGIVNWGVPCARGYPDAFAKVSYFYNWIGETIQQFI